MLTRENRPGALPARTTRGKRKHKPFEQLKWLAASRLAAAGLSFKEALALLPTKQASYHVVASDDPNGVLPAFASAGAWSTAVSKARLLIRTLLPDPRE